MKNTIALINVQIGSYKNYNSLFLNSCKENKDVDFYFFTDQDIPVLSKNIHIVKISFLEVKEKIQGLFDFPINLDSPYDLCDYKVAYGEIFQEYISDYDFWGYCDTDMVFGNIRAFLTEEILDKHDKVLIRGHFILFRNTHPYFNCYRLPLSDGRLRYKEVFSDSGVHHFDEGMPDLLEGINMIFSQNFGWDKVYDEYIFMDLDVNSWMFINSDFKNDNQEQQKASNSFFKWSNGKLERIKIDRSGSVIDREPFMYIHFQKRDMKVECEVDSGEFYIIPNKFIAPEIGAKQMYKANDNKIYWSKLMERVSKKINRTLKRR